MFRAFLGVFYFCVSGIVVDQNQALRFAIDVAQGMEFLHTLEPAIPNFHLNSKHVMVRMPPEQDSAMGWSFYFLLFINTTDFVQINLVMFHPFGLFLFWADYVLF